MEKRNIIAILLIVLGFLGILYFFLKPKTINVPTAPLPAIETPALPQLPEGQEGGQGKEIEIPSQ